MRTKVMMGVFMLLMVMAAPAAAQGPDAIAWYEATTVVPVWIAVAAVAGLLVLLGLVILLAMALRGAAPKELVDQVFWMAESVREMIPAEFLTRELENYKTKAEQTPQIADDILASIAERVAAMVIPVVRKEVESEQDLAARQAAARDWLHQDDGDTQPVSSLLEPEPNA